MTRRTTVIGLIAAMLAVAPAAHAQPANDDFEDAAVIAAIPYTDEQSTEDATTEAGEPDPCGFIGATVWYRYGADSEAALTADTFGSDFDTVLAVYTGDSLATLEEVACDDDTVDLQSQVTFQTQAGETYHFQVGGFDSDTGPLRFRVDITGSISGTVTDEATSSPLGDVCVDVVGSDGWSSVGFGYTEPDGTYTVDGVSGGTHKVRFDDCSGGGYVSEWYDDKGSFDAADPVVVVGGLETAGIDAALAVGGSISGRLTDEAGAPIEDVCVQAYRDADPSGEGYDTGSTNQDGRYRIRGLRAGDYRVEFAGCGPIFVPRPEPSLSYHDGPSSLYASEWWDDKPDFESADLIGVVLGIDTPDIDAVLALRPRPDVAVTHLAVEAVPLRTDQGELPASTGWTRRVTVGVENLGTARANGARLTVVACPRTAGGCEEIGRVNGSLDAGEAVERTFNWTAIGWAGDVRIRARVRAFDDANRRNDARSVDHFVILGGTGVGVHACAGVPPFLPGPSPQPCA